MCYMIPFESETGISAEKGNLMCPPYKDSNFLTTVTREKEFFYAGKIYNEDESSNFIFNFDINRSVGIVKKNYLNQVIQTLILSLKWLNLDAHFVASFENRKFVYFVFRETAIEALNCDSNEIFSRVARICKNDNGSKQVFLTFVKARIVCFLPGQNSLYYNEVIAAKFINGRLYALFKISHSSINEFALCVFSEEEINSAFEGNFLRQYKENMLWQSITSKEARMQFNCEEQNIESQEFVQDNFLLAEKEIKPLTESPLIVEKFFNFTHIDVISSTTFNNQRVDTILLLTRYNTLKRYVLQDQIESKICMISERQLPINENDFVLTMKANARLNSIVIGTIKEVIKLSIADCEKYTKKYECLHSHDPFCGWSVKSEKCKPFNEVHIKEWEQVNEFKCKVPNKKWSNWKECNETSARTKNYCLCRHEICYSEECLNKAREIQK
ncbi:hypothetical protein B4U79_06762 [Dinothrombium tinctorium]|uniref:Sema domain-containing protein n=1 Tax=Dinothrombium tinctorium TaxID=1965070 RepID=A0A443QSH6_9ACAR|nr:hypothetical protein B4U79_11438 [Dinothrombium tinctorium]RWS07083.1 hypothetical protein B4U79_06762 [Dinothrombium tinctorium]